MTASSAQTEPDYLTDALVEAYLRDHPDFFERHPSVLDVLHVPHPAGGSISLIERQVRVLRDKHRALEQRLGELVEHARENERVGGHLHRLACTLMQAEDIDAVLALTQEALRDEVQAELVSIRLIGAEHGELHRLPAADLGAFEDLFGRGRPQCGRLPRPALEALFGAEAEAEGIGSAILMPLATGGERIGVLGLGSRSAERFLPDMGIYFLTHLGELLTASIRYHGDRARSSV